MKKILMIIFILASTTKTLNAIEGDYAQQDKVCRLKHPGERCVFIEDTGSIKFRVGWCQYDYDSDGLLCMEHLR